MNIAPDVLKGQCLVALHRWPWIPTMEIEYSLPPGLLLAVGSRETNLTNEAGDYSRRPGEKYPQCHGFGVWQRDSGAFPGTNSLYLMDVARQGDDAAHELATAYHVLGNWAHAISAYNCGLGAAQAAIRLGHDPDDYTTGHDYAHDVLARRGLIVTWGLVQPLPAPSIEGLSPMYIVAASGHLWLVGSNGRTAQILDSTQHSAIGKILSKVESQLTDSEWHSACEVLGRLAS